MIVCAPPSIHVSLCPDIMGLFYGGGASLVAIKTTAFENWAVLFMCSYVAK